MRILVVHNRYRATAPSGENLVVDQEAAALAAAGHEVGRFERDSTEIASWPAVRKAALPLTVMWSEGSRRALAERIVGFAPDVVHVHNTFPLLTPAVLYACRDAGVPVVATIHNYKMGCASGELFRDGHVCHDCLGRRAQLPALVHGCYRGSPLATLPVVAGRSVHAGMWRRLVSAFVFISAAQRDVLAPFGFPPGRTFVKHNFVPPLAAGNAPDALPGQSVAFVGRLDEAKGLRLLMQAWDGFQSAHPASGLRLDIAGGGPLQDEVATWAASRPGVTFLGHVPREEVARILGRATAAVVPSVWEETFGLVVPEAMSAGTAVIAPAHGAFPELVTPGTDGALFRPGDAGELAGLLASVDRDPGHWRAAGERARQTYRRRFTADASIPLLLEIYRFAMEYPAGQPVRPSGGLGIAAVPGASS